MGPHSYFSFSTCTITFLTLLSRAIFTPARSHSSALVPGDALPRFWIFMYRVSPFTYLIEGMLSVGVGQTTVTCSSTELLHFDAPSGQTCGSYMTPWIDAYGGKLSNPAAGSDCQFCAIDSTDTFLATFGIYYSNR